MLGMSRLAIEQHLVGLFEQREHDVVEVRRHVDDDEVEHRAQHAHHADHLLGRDPLARRRLDRRAQHAQRRRFVRREEAVHQLRVDGLDHRGRVGRRVLRRHAEEHRVVAELEVGVDEHDPPGVAGREQHREVGRDDALADATLGREGDEDLAEPRGLGRGRRGAVHDARHASRRRARPPSGSGVSPASIVSASRTPARSASWSSGSVSSSASSTTPTSGKLRAMRCTAARPSGVGEARAEHDHGRFAGHELARDLVDGRRAARARCRRARA